MTAFDLPAEMMLVFLFVIGSCIGSFLNVCIYRLPLYENIARAWSGLNHPPSHCPFCNTRIWSIDNIPIIGWLKLRGRCRACRHRIPPRYMLIEFANGLLWVVTYLCIVPVKWGSVISASWLFTDLNWQAASLGHWAAVTHVHLQYLYFMVLLEALLVATFIDFDLRIIPDSVTVPAMVVGFLGMIAAPALFLVPAWFQDPGVLGELRMLLPDGWEAWLEGPRVPLWFKQFPRLHAALVSLAGFVVGGGSIWIIRIIGHWALKQEAMGFGDVILMAMIGSFIGWQPVLMVFFLAPFCAVIVVLITAIVSRGEQEIPYGPYLSLATLLVVLGWQNWYHAVAARVFGAGPMLILLAAIMIPLFAILLRITRLVKTLLGWQPDDDEEVLAEWTSADQLAFNAWKNLDRAPRDLRRENWPGSSSSRGSIHHHRWQNGGR